MERINALKKKIGKLEKKLSRLQTEQITYEFHNMPRHHLVAVIESMTFPLIPQAMGNPRPRLRRRQHSVIKSMIAEYNNTAISILDAYP